MNATDFCALMQEWATIMAENKTRLIVLDSAVGDSDLGLTMSDGFAAAAQAAKQSEETDIGKLAYQAGKAMAAAAPSTMGTLMASGLMNAGKALKGVEALNAKQEASFFRAYFDGVQARGNAALGDKTFLDGFYPAVETLERCADAGIPQPQAADLSAKAAEEAYENTVGLLAKHGRMAIRGEDSRKLLDPGAAVAALLMEGYARFYRGKE